MRILWGAKTSRTMRVVWALHELGLDYDHRPIESRSGETATDVYTDINPRQKIPCLQDGGLTLAESAGIVTYLGERYGPCTDGNELVPAPNTDERAFYFQWCFFMMTELDAHTLYVLRKHRDLVHLYGDAPNANKHAEEGFAKQVAVVAKAFDDGREYLLGPAFSGADIILESIIGWAIRYEQPVPDALLTYSERVRRRPHFATAYEANYRPNESLPRIAI
jgi:glutathione S-transferase